MQNFTFHVSTKILFGKREITKLHQEIARYGKNVLLVYGHGAIKKNGLYDEVISELKKAQMNVFELSGIDPNPRITSVREGAKLCKEHNIDIILAVGGGSVIDCSKFIAAAPFYDGDPWDFFVKDAKIEKALPVASVLTLSAAGSEMDCGGVITNLQTQEKIGRAAKCLLPVFSILDPTYTQTVSPYQTASGSIDIISHILEVYFNKEQGSFVQQQIAIALLKTVIKYAPIAIKDGNNYEARANLMWASSLAINDLISAGQSYGWTVHPLEHELSAFYDIAHGVGLGILTPHWMEEVLSKENAHLFATLAKELFNLSHADEYELAKQGIASMKSFLASLGVPTTLSQCEITAEHFDIMVKRVHPKLEESFVFLSELQLLNILKKAL